MESTEPGDVGAHGLNTGSRDTQRSETDRLTSAWKTSWQVRGSSVLRRGREDRGLSAGESRGALSVRERRGRIRERMGQAGPRREAARPRGKRSSPKKSAQAD